MKAATAKKALAGSLLAIVLSVSPTAMASAHTYPYIKSYGGDVSAGGWFNNAATGSSCASSSNYQGPSYSSGSNKNLYGGILTYAKDDSGISAGGSSSQYGVFATGNIDTQDFVYDVNWPVTGGFYSDGAVVATGAGTPVGQLSFANFGNLANSWGGQFDGASPQGDCIPDYYTSKQTNTQNYTGDISNWSALNGNYIFNNAGITVINSVPVSTAAGKNIALFINGNAYIGANITYASHNPTNVPKFALIVRGNIYISPSVTQLDGWYIAQPADSGTPATNDGLIWTCHENDNATTLDASYVSACRQPFVVNGGLVAKRINFARARGNLTATTTEDSLSGGLASSNIAEIINYSPDMVIGGPFFNVNLSYGLDSLVSLPPVF